MPNLKYSVAHTVYKVIFIQSRGNLSFVFKSNPFPQAYYTSRQAQQHRKVDHETLTPERSYTCLETMGRSASVAIDRPDFCDRSHGQRGGHYHGDQNLYIHRR